MVRLQNFKSFYFCTFIFEYAENVEQQKFYIIIIYCKCQLFVPGYQQNYIFEMITQQESRDKGTRCSLKMDRRDR